MSKGKKKKNNTPNKDVKIEKEKQEEKVAVKIENSISKEKKVNKHPFIHGFLILVLFTSLAYFIISLFFDKANSLTTLINSLLLVIFTLLFVSVSISTNRKNKNGFLVSALVLFGYFIFSGLITLGIITLPSNRVENFTNKSFAEVMEWAEKRKISVIQQYEYSDIIDEYSVISQDVEPGTKIKEVSSITVAISEGPNPSKEVIVPNMVGWESEQVLEFIKENHLSNVLVEFVESSSMKDTVIEQSKSGNVKRDEEIKFVFSYGEVFEDTEVKLIDFTGMSKFEVTFYLKRYKLNYEFTDGFSSKIKRGYAVSQSVKAGTLVKSDGDKIRVVISKGPKIKVPNLKEMSMSEITEWVIKNKLKLKFVDKYDDSIDENSVISANYNENDVVEEGTVIEVTISRGKLKMPKVSSLGEFKEWADKYEVKYEEQHEFSNDVKAGEVISYSHKAGDTIKNGDSVIIVISDGKETKVPDVVGLTKTDATKKLKNAGFGYNFVYSYSSSVAEGKAIKQSISAGSSVSEGTTITVTLSKGPRPASSSNSGSSGSSNSGGSSSGGSSEPACDTSKGAIFWDAAGQTGAQTVSMLKEQNPGFNIVHTYVDSCPNGSTNSGEVCSINIKPETWISYCTTIKVTIVK